MGKTYSDVEVIYVVASSRDKKGRRVMIRHGHIENYLWPWEELTDSGFNLLGVPKEQRRLIIKFLKKN